MSAHEFYLSPQSINQVHCRGEALDPILWRGDQWAVTTYGLECRDGTYSVQAGKHFSNFGATYWTEKRYNPQSVFVGWFRHLSGKSWCNPDDLNAALQAMFVLFNEDGTRTQIAAPRLVSDAIRARICGD